MVNNELGRQENYTGYKFLIEDYKSIFNNIMKTSSLLKNFGVSSSLRDTVEKNYYDTQDMFFRKNGVNISVNVYKNRPYADLVIRYDSAVKRIQFLSDIPDTFIKKIGKHDKIYQYYDYIAKAIGELCPNGLNINVLETVKTIVLKLKVTKKRDRYRAINSRGLKIILSFEQSVYMNAKRSKVKLNILELRLDSPSNTQLMFDEFVHSLQLAEYRLIKVQNSDLFIGQDYLDV